MLDEMLGWFAGVLIINFVLWLFCFGTFFLKKNDFEGLSNKISNDNDDENFVKNDSVRSSHSQFQRN